MFCFQSAAKRHHYKTEYDTEHLYRLWNVPYFLSDYMVSVEEICSMLIQYLTRSIHSIIVCTVIGGGVFA